MDEKGQGAIEYLLMLAVALAVISSAFALIFGIFNDLAPQVESKISGIRENLINELT